MEYLKLPPSSRRIGCHDHVLRPTENGINPNLLRRNAGNRDVLRQMAEIKDVRLDRQAFAKIPRIWLQHAIGGAVAADTQKRQYHHESHYQSMFHGYTHMFDA